MIRSQKKLSEKIDQPEKLSQSEELLLRYHKTSGWVRENSSKAIGIGVGVVVLIALFFVWRSKQADNSEHAEIMLSRISPLYHSGDWRKAIDGDPKERLQNEPLRGLKEIANEYGSTHAGEIA